MDESKAKLSAHKTVVEFESDVYKTLYFCMPLFLVFKSVYQVGFCFHLLFQNATLTTNYVIFVQ